jgi:5'-methylthioadenosine phosphorylase
VAAIPKTRGCKCGSALANAIITDRTKIPPRTRKKLQLLIGKYLDQKAKK